MEICSICVEPVDDVAGPTGSVTLECGHTFHCECAIQWFRYHHTSCPNCRADDVENGWKRVTPQQRIANMRRQRHTLTRRVRRRLETYDTLTVRLREEQRSFSEFKRQHRDVLKEHSRMENAVTKLKFQHHELLRQLSWTAIPNVPHLTHYTEDSDS